ncbi:3'-5' exonuclease [Thauera chlorobenzoica]|uniref:DnaQ-like 3'-5' exonuclease domain superfamily protein n=1 Tax=Thauera chlorobenzoica TaxID=96773 RepID=A0A1H5WAX9_9RHOO|nr:3'-5' exonuclease [Thauera chlorobenzoica]APR03225.1 DnaQ-like 3'-5' exonuclease domain superfamily protein [Thauera chlorobenzoica]SEF96595.1 DNA polymerase-3 subunit epsilon [Thauera chlorobenzoica]
MLHLGDLRSLQGKREGGRRTDAQGPDWSRRFAGLAAAARDPRLRRFYAESLPAAATPMGEVPMVAVDIETTGLDPRRDGIVSIGAIPMRLDRIQSSASHYWVLRPRARLNPESVVIHGITHAQIEAAPDFGAILGELLAVLAGRVVVVHCREIERAFLDAALRACIGEGIEFPVIDTMALESRLQRRPPAAWLARVFGRRPAPLSVRLADCRARYRLPRYRAHHALTDALATAELLQAQLAHHFGPEAAVRTLWQ